MERSGVQPWNVQGYNLRGPSPNSFSETAWLIFDARLARSPTAPRRRQACSFPATLMQGKASAPVGRLAGLARSRRQVLSCSKTTHARVRKPQHFLSATSHASSGRGKGRCHCPGSAAARPAEMHFRYTSPVSSLACIAWLLCTRATPDVVTATSRGTTPWTACVSMMLRTR